MVEEIKRLIMDATGEYDSSDVFAALNELVLMVLCDQATDGGTRKAGVSKLVEMYRELANELEVNNLGTRH